MHRKNWLRRASLRVERCDRTTQKRKQINIMIQAENDSKKITAPFKWAMDFSTFVCLERRVLCSFSATRINPTKYSQQKNRKIYVMTMSETLKTWAKDKKRAERCQVFKLCTTNEIYTTSELGLFAIFLLLFSISRSQKTSAVETHPIGYC